MKEHHDLAFLDGLRGLAALWVLLGHCNVWSGHQLLPVPNPKTAVDLFMLLSGFLMVWNYGGQDGCGVMFSARDVMRFYFRRFMRLAPLYYVVLAFMWLFGSGVLEGFTIWQKLNPSFWQIEGMDVYDPHKIVFDLNNLFAHVTFLFGLHPDMGFSTMLPDWSLSLEMQFYFVFPFLLALMRFGRLEFAIIAWLTCLLFWRFRPVYEEPSLLAFKLHVFASGMLLAWGVRQKASRGSVLVLLCATLLVGWEARLLLPFVIIFWIGTDLENISPRFQGCVNALLSNSVARFFGRLSYGIYLVHGIVIALLAHCLPGQQWFDSSLPYIRSFTVMLLTLLISVFISWLLHHVIEVPGQQLGRRILGRKSES